MAANSAKYYLGKTSGDFRNDYAVASLKEDGVATTDTCPTFQYIYFFMKKNIYFQYLLFAFLLAIFLMPHAVFAAWAPSQIDTLKQQFVTGIGRIYQTAEFPWLFLNPEECFTPGVSCYFSNPDGPYGYPSNGGKLYIGMAATDALVLIMETPPPMRYFGITPYIFSRYYPSLPLAPRKSGTVQVFESLGDTVNMANVGTAGSPVAGGNPFTQLSVFVMTADQNTYNHIYWQFVALDLPSYAINQVAMPLTAVPLKMGIGPAADTFSIMMRLAYPDDPDQMQDYLTRVPIRFLHLSALKKRSTLAMPTPVSKIPGNGLREPAELETARDQLVSQLLAQYGNAYTITERAINLTQTNNYVCVEYGVSCNGDNPDALYSRDINKFIPTSPADKILIVGINHVLTGKDTYVSHSVINDLHQVGVQGASDFWFQGSALAMAGIVSSSDPRYLAYEQLYAFTISYDCIGEAVCLQIEEPTLNDPIGVPFGDPLDISARYYMDPVTETRPSSSEVILHRVFLLMKM